jgi:FixJ family two-component response regulator
VRFVVAFSEQGEAYDQNASCGVTQHVAIVDDDESVRRAMARLISAHSSFPVRCYASAREFLNSLEDDEPGCLILDSRMPDMTGLELLHHLAGSGSKIPVIVSTADDEPGLRHRCELAGAFDFLTKPAPAAMVMSAVNRATAARSTVAAEG